MQGAIVLIVSALVLLPELGRREFTTRAEARIPMVALDILRTGRILPPYLLGEPYLNKPPLQHLLTAGGIRILGRHDEAAVRIPSVVSAALAIWLMWMIGKSLAGPRAGWIAAGFLLSGYKFFVLSRSTELEVLLTAAICVAYLGLARALWRQPASRDGWWIAAGGMAVASVTKGPAIALIFPFTLLVADAIVRRTARHVLSLGPLILILGAALGTAAYYLPLIVKFGGIGALKERLAFENVLHRHPFHFYFWQLPLCLLPASLALPWMIARLRRPEPIARACALAVAIGVLGFSLSSSKQAHYLLPFFPLVALWAGVSGVFERWKTGMLVIVPLVVIPMFFVIERLEGSAGTDARVPDPPQVMRNFGGLSLGKPLAMMDRQPVLAYYLDRPDLLVLENAAAAARLIDEQDARVVVVLDDGETLPPELDRFRPAAPSEQVVAAPNRTYLLLSRRNR